MEMIHNQSSSTHLKRHKALHDEKPFTCGYCSTKFRDKYHLNRHVKYVHLRADGKSFMCEYCPKGFCSNNSLNRHINSVHQMSIEESLDLPVVEIKFELDDDCTGDKVESLTEDVKKEIIEDDNDFHIINLP